MTAAKIENQYKRFSFNIFLINPKCSVLKNIRMQASDLKRDKEKNVIRSEENERAVVIFIDYNVIMWTPSVVCGYRILTGAGCVCVFVCKCVCVVVCV
jgi:hypothetical protein